MKKHDTTAEPPAAATAAADAAETGDSALATLQADLDRFRDLALRSQADLENFRKRATREREESVRYANARLLEGLLPIMDSFELGLTAARAAAGAGDAALVKGVELVAKQLADFAAAHGLVPVEAAGEAFDPNWHEALAQETSATVAEGRVVRQIRRGYKLHDRLLRPAHVIVAKGRE